MINKTAGSRAHILYGCNSCPDYKGYKVTDQCGELHMNLESTSDGKHNGHVMMTHPLRRRQGVPN